MAVFAVPHAFGFRVFMVKNFCGIDVTVMRKNIKNTYIRVGKDCSVTVTCLYSVSDCKIEKFISDNLAKLNEIIAKRRALLNCGYKTLNRLYVFGVNKLLEYGVGENYVVETCDSVKVYTLTNSDAEVEKLIADFLKRKLSHELDKLIEFWQGVTGLYSSGYGVRKTRGRWGSCNCSTYKLSFSLYLANVPLECVSYVVLHEICHIKYPNHGNGFKRLLTKYMPEWKIIKKRLNERGEVMRYIP